MELNWSTFILEILNFLVLVWILKHFLYKPVLDVIARRRAGIEQSLHEAGQRRAEAAALKIRYEGRLADWDRERGQAREQLAHELEAERSNALAELQSALDHEREKARVSEQRHLEALQHSYEDTALEQGARFAARLLEHTAGPETESRLVELLIEELGQLSAERIAELRQAQEQQPASILVSSAFPLPDSQRQRLQQALAPVTGGADMQFKQDQELVAGVRITIGAWLLGASVRDELRGFTGISHAG